MRTIVFTILVAFTTTLFAQQKESFDLASYTIPKGWQNKSTEYAAGYVVTNKQKGTYCQVGIYKSTASKGNLKADFESEWQELIVKTYKPTANPQLTPSPSENGWDAQGGAAPFLFNGQQSVAMLVTMSGHGRCMSIVILTNTDEFQQPIEKFLESIDLKKPETNSQPATPVIISEKSKAAPVKPAVSGSFQFVTTNFDDGWVSTIHEDWVNVVKGDIRVLLHYPTSKIDDSSSDFKVISTNAWNTLVAPRYNTLNNYYVFPGSADYERPYFVSGDVTDNSTGKNVHVVLFQRGRSGWIEIISSGKNVFVQHFGVDILKVDYYADSEIWSPLQKLANYNKFAVAASDLKGKWTNNFSGMTQYVNMYTGADAGAKTHSSNEVFEFSAGNTYKWELNVAGGMVGNIKFQNVKANGTITLPNNWQIRFSEMEGKPKIYNAYFSCVKGARMLWLEDSGYPIGYTSYGRSE
ncbi:MAG: hypothetical protein C0490_03000 [Marivirga sp.]|nr:hypothetical protein [Marivirga sp.]